MNQPPNTTEEKSKSKCCGAEKKWRKTSCTCKNESDQECYQIHHEKVCSKCYKPFVPTPSVCEVAKVESKCPHRDCWKVKYHDCPIHGRNAITFTPEPKKTVEKCICENGELLQKVDKCPVHSTPIQTGNDEWEEEFEKKFPIEIWDKLLTSELKSFVRSVEQKAVLQERERNETKILGLETVIKGQEIMLESLLPLRRYN